MKGYTFSNVNELDYQILVPIWGDIKYLENIEYLSTYSSKVTLCTTGNGSDDFYTSLNTLADKYGFQIFKDKPNNFFEKSNKRTTSGSMRDTTIRNALKTVKTLFVVTLDADSTTTRDMSYLVGELEHRNLDIASIRIIPNNANASLLTRLQAFEYNVAMNFRYLCPWLISGACHVAKTDVLENIMNRHSLFFQGNDVETGLLAKMLGYKVGHIPFVVLTAVPDNFRSWFRQRLAWGGGEFRIYIINFKFIFRHPFFWFYGAIVTICLFPLRLYALFTFSHHLYFVLAVYIGLAFCLHWKKKNIYLFLMPFYTLFLSSIMTPLGILWYFKMAHKDKNYGIIKSSRR